MSNFMTFMLIRERLSCRTTRRLIQSQSRDTGDILEQLEVVFLSLTRGCDVAQDGANSHSSLLVLALRKQHDGGNGEKNPTEN